MKNNVIKRIPILLICAAIVFASVFACLGTGQTAFAADEASANTVWGGQDTSELWYYKDGFLNIERAKDIVSSWDKSRLSKDDPVIIAVVDTGIDASHELFEDVLMRSGDKLLGYNVNAPEGAENVDISDEPSKHGSATAGVIAMLIHEFGLQDYIKIYPIKANSINEDLFALTATIKSLDWAKKNVKADVINLSFGIAKKDINSSADWQNDKSFIAKINEVAQDSVIVAAAGNKGSNSTVANEVFYPAAHDGVVSVMGYGIPQDGGKKELYKTSNYGGSYDIVAPGEDIYTSMGTANSGRVSKYGAVNGTSVATPIVSFAAALLKLRFAAEGQPAPSGSGLARMLRNLDCDKIEKGESYTVANGTAFDTVDMYTLLSQDFDTTDYQYKNPTGITVTYSNDDKHLDNPAFPDTAYLTADKIETIHYLATIDPYGQTDPDYADSVEWYVTDLYGATRLVGTGLNYDFTAQGGGSYTVTARLKVGTQEFEASAGVFIEFLPYISGDVRVTTKEQAGLSAKEVSGAGTVYTKQGEVFALTGTEFLDPRTEIKWFVNGKQAATGVEFNFKPKKTGEYVITAQYGDNSVIVGEYAYTAHVKSFILRPLDLSMLIIGIVVILAVGSVCIALVVKHKKEAEQVDREITEDRSEN